MAEDEDREVDFVGQLDEAVEGGDARIEHGRPGVDVGDVLQPSRECRQELCLLR